MEAQPGLLYRAEQLICYVQFTLPMPIQVYVGGDGTILKTTNGGTTWTALSSGTSDLTSVYFTDASTGYAVGGIGHIHIQKS